MKEISQDISSIPTMPESKDAELRQTEKLLKQLQAPAGKAPPCVSASLLLL